MPDEFAESADSDDPQQVRARLFSAVRTLVEAASRERPVVLAIEDIHWADEGMLDLIEYLARWVRGPVLMICLARDELLDRRPGWGGGRRNATTIALEPLPPTGARELVHALLPDGAEEIEEALVAQVAERSGGNPLFAEEMVNRILEEGMSGDAALPETVHAVLAARLDALDPKERSLLQHASVVGQSFWASSVAEGDDAQDLLGSLADKDLIVATAGSRLKGEREYAFKHVLIRDVAYSTLPKTVRARKHAEVATFIEERAADRTEAVIAMVADHLGRRPRSGRTRAWRNRSSTLSATAPTRRSRQRETSRPASTRTRRRSPNTRRRSSSTATTTTATTPTPAPASPRSTATSRSGWAGSTRRSSCGSAASSITAARRTWRGSATFTGRSARASGTRATARARSAITSAASTS